MPNSKSTISMNKSKMKSPIDELKALSPATSSINLDTTNIITFIIVLISMIVVLILHYAMYTWTAELEKNGCKCSEIWHRNVIHWIALILLITVFINTLLKIANIKSPMFQAFIIVIAILNIFYIAIVFDYITKLKKLECECSEDWKRDYGYIGSIVYIISFSLILLSLILNGIFIFAK
jgi:magnesium-transporting ATPase (P-type)